MKLLTLIVLLLCSCSTPEQRPAVVLNDVRVLHYHLRVEDHRITASVEAACRAWEKSGKVVFTPSSIRPDFTVEVAPLYPTEACKAGICSRAASWSPARRVITLNANRSIKRFTPILISHEIGHVLGLSHDPSERSVMFAGRDTVLPGSHDFTKLP